MKSVRLEPDWVNMFRYATQMIKDRVPEDQGREFLVLMMEFGGRLYEDSQRIDPTDAISPSVGKLNKEFQSELHGNSQYGQK